MKKRNTVHAHSAVRQREIIEAALACFTKKGFTETSVADICQAAGASTGSVYHHFKSKNGVAAAIYLEGIRDYQTGMVNRLSSQTDPLSGIVAVVAYHLNWVESHPAWARFLFHYRHADFMADAEDAMNRLNAEFAQGMGQWFRRHIQAGDIKPLPRDVIIALLLGPCQEFARLYLAGHAVTSVTEAAETMAASVWAALKTGP